jgi:hypothetical protein
VAKHITDEGFGRVWNNFHHSLESRGSAIRDYEKLGIVLESQWTDFAEGGNRGREVEGLHGGGQGVMSVIKSERGWLVGGRCAGKGEGNGCE